MKNLNLYIYLEHEFAEFTLNGIDYRVDFISNNFHCDFNSLVFSYTDENFDRVDILVTNLENHGFDLDFKEWVHEEISTQLKEHFEDYYYEDEDWKEKYYQTKYGF